MTPAFAVYVGLVLARVGAFAAVAPPFAGRTPRLVRVGMTVALTALLRVRGQPRVGADHNGGPARVRAGPGPGGPDRGGDGVRVRPVPAAGPAGRGVRHPAGGAKRLPPGRADRDGLGRGHHHRVRDGGRPGVPGGRRAPPGPVRPTRLVRRAAPGRADGAGGRADDRRAGLGLRDGRPAGRAAGPVPVSAGRHPGRHGPGGPAVERLLGRVHLAGVGRAPRRAVPPAGPGDDDARHRRPDRGGAAAAAGRHIVVGTLRVPTTAHGVCGLRWRSSADGRGNRPRIQDRGPHPTPVGGSPPPGTGPV